MIEASAGKLEENQCQSAVGPGMVLTIIDGTMTADQQLRSLASREDIVETSPELAERVDDVWDTLGRVEPSDLANVSTSRPQKLVHANVAALRLEHPHVVVQVPGPHGLAQTIQPVCLLDCQHQYIASMVPG